MQEKHLILITLCIFYSKKHKPSYITRKKKKKNKKQNSENTQTSSVLFLSSLIGETKKGKPWMTMLSLSLEILDFRKTFLKNQSFIN
jgi:hypothetical protein